MTDVGVSQKKCGEYARGGRDRTLPIFAVARSQKPAASLCRHPREPAMAKTPSCLTGSAWTHVSATRYMFDDGDHRDDSRAMRPSGMGSGFIPGVDGVGLRVSGLIGEQMQGRQPSSTNPWAVTWHQVLHDDVRTGRTDHRFEATGQRLDLPAMVGERPISRSEQGMDGRWLASGQRQPRTG